MTYPQEPENRIRVGISDNFEFDGISIFIGIRIDHQQTSIIRFDENGRPRFEIVESMAEVMPSIKINNDFARALLDALMRHYQGASDTRALRSDYAHERGRVDKLLDVISTIAANKQVIQVVPFQSDRMENAQAS